MRVVWMQREGKEKLEEGLAGNCMEKGNVMQRLNFPDRELKIQ